MMSAPMVCAGIGSAAALAFMCQEHNNRKTKALSPSTCVSARAAAFTESVSNEATDDESQDLWGLSEDAEKQFESYSGVAHKDPQSEAVKRAKLELRPKHVDTKLNKDIGSVIPRIGCSVDVTPPRVTGALMFNVSEAYASAMDQASGK